MPLVADVGAGREGAPSVTILSEGHQVCPPVVDVGAGRKGAPYDTKLRGDQDDFANEGLCGRPARGRPIAAVEEVEDDDLKLRNFLQGLRRVCG